MNKNILVAVDFSDINSVAVERAAELARQSGGKLFLLNVVEHFPLEQGPLASVFQSSTDSVQNVSRQVYSRLQTVADALGYDRVEVAVRVSSKSARHEILEFAGENGIDLIVVAPHGQGIIGSLGSTATGVINNARCDVLAVREPE